MRITRFDPKSEQTSRLCSSRRDKIEWIAEAVGPRFQGDELERLCFERPEPGFYDHDPDLATARAKRGLACTVSTYLMLCRVDPETSFENGHFVSHTGYFIVEVDVGAFELVKLH